MDKTDQYIKMIRKAPEIQEMRKRGARNEIIKDKNDFTVAFFPTENDRINHMEIDDYWLPRQDQLQEMITDNGYFRFSLIELFYRFCMNMMDILRFTSMEQLWLAFVMKTKYNKIWDGEDWIVD